MDRGGGAVSDFPGNCRQEAGCAECRGGSAQTEPQGAVPRPCARGRSPANDSSSPESHFPSEGGAAATWNEVTVQ